MFKTLTVTFLAVLPFFLVCVNAHAGAFHRSMYCMRGNQVGVDDEYATAAVQPLFNLAQSQWWFHAVNNCDQFPPDEGQFLELPANGAFTVEHAVNRVFTTLANNPILGTFVDGQEHPDLGISNDGKPPGSDCITQPNIHTQNQTMAAGTAFAISYVSDLSEVTQENLVVFSVLYNTPWKRIATYSVPDLPPCPAGGCICAFGWLPNGCGEPDMYMQGFRCAVTGSSNPVRTIKYPAAAPQWCEEDSTTCVSGAKQMIYWSQAEGNNVVVSGNDKFGNPKSPGYNMKMGFANGAQTDIFSN